MECPQILVAAHARMLDPLQAEELMAGSEYTAVGSGSLETRTARGIIRDWRRRVAAVRRSTSRAQRSPESLAAIGIKVEAPRPAADGAPAAKGD
jgi:hypothetical protein